MNKDELYEKLDNDESLTDSERREIYRSEIEQAHQEWMDENW